jgi:hypothetical protein
MIQKDQLGKFISYRESEERIQRNFTLKISHSLLKNSKTSLAMDLPAIE